MGSYPGAKLVSSPSLSNVANITVIGTTTTRNLTVSHTASFVSLTTSGNIGATGTVIAAGYVTTTIETYAASGVISTVSGLALLDAATAETLTLAVGSIGQILMLANIGTAVWTIDAIAGGTVGNTGASSISIAAGGFAQFMYNGSNNWVQVG